MAEASSTGTPEARCESESLSACPSECHTRHTRLVYSVRRSERNANLNPLIHVGEHLCLPRQASSDDFGNSESLK